MKCRIQGWKYALLFVWLMGLAGCSGRGEIYTAGELQTYGTQLCSETENAGPETFSGRSGDAEEDAAGEDGTSDAEGGNRASAAGLEDGTPDAEGDSGASAAGLEDGTPDAEGGNGASAAGERETEPAGYVYVCGAVAQPGVYPMHEGMRVFEALELAGGFTGDADREWLNQAELLRDGARLYVYTKEETSQLAENAGESGRRMWQEDAGSLENAEAADGPDGQKININTAGCEELKTLPGIGDAKADAVVQYRSEHGPFASIEEIQNISGIKSAVFAKIRDLITV